MEIKNKNIITLVTHSGSFHTDDIFACATLSTLLEKRGEQFEIKRTRDEKIITGGDYVFDVGGIYDENLNRFDHHQKGGSGKRENDIEYSSFGLVWKKFGEELCGSKEIALFVDKNLVASIDAHDNGIDLVEHIHEVSPYLIQRAFRSFEPTWREVDLSNDDMFFKGVNMAKDILEREIVHARDYLIAEKAVRIAYENAIDKRIIILDQDYPADFSVKNFPEAFFVIYLRNDGKYGVKTIRVESKSFKNRKDFPESWGGLSDAELVNITGVSDAVFCHRKLFLVVAQSLGGAKKLAEQALSI